MTQNNKKPEPIKLRLLTETETAERLNIAVATLRRWRWEGHPPPFVKLGRTVRYDPAEVEHYIESGRHSSTAECES